MKTNLRIYELMAMAAIFGGDNMARDISRRREVDLEAERPKPPPPKGLKKFFINGQEVWAINEKNAIRKANQ